jgi:hypothetical protein
MAGKITVSTINDSSGVLATQNGMTGIAKAWVLFNGTAGTITNAFNVSSITKNSTGNWTISFTTAMSNANYAVSACCDTWTTSNVPTVVNTLQGGTYTTSSLQIITTYGYDTNYKDTPKVGVVILSN